MPNLMWRRCLTAFLLIAVLVLPRLALTQVTPQSTGLTQAAQGTGLQNACGGDPQTCVAQLIGNIIRFALGFVEVLLFLYFLYGGFLWLTSGGDTKGVDKAKIVLKNSTVGLVIIAV